MTNTTPTAAKKTIKLYRNELIAMLADHRVDTYPELYGRVAGKSPCCAEHYASAVFFVTHHEGPTKSDLVLSAQCHGLIPFNVEVR